MTQHQDQNFNQKHPSQSIEGQEFRYADEASISELINEAQLSNEELASISGGSKNSSDLLQQGISHDALGEGTKSFEPEPTFPTPPHLESLS
jgi:bacteriocin-like protein